MRERVDIVVELSSLLLFPAVLAICAYLGFKSSALLIFCSVVFSLAMFYMNWESSTPALRQILPAAVLSAIAAISRIIFAPIPSIQPVTAICIIAGLAFGRREGFVVGSLSAFVSNCFLGQGIWTPWQMYAWGLVGYLSGAIFAGRNEAPQKKYHKILRLALVCVFGFLASYLFSFVMDSWMVFGFSKGLDTESIIAIYLASIPFDLMHEVSTVLFLAILYPAWEGKLRRINKKYSLSSIDA